MSAGQFLAGSSVGSYQHRAQYPTFTGLSHNAGIQQDQLSHQGNTAMQQDPQKGSSSGDYGGPAC